MGATAHTFTFAVRGPIGRDDLPGLCARVCALFSEHGPGVVHCDVETVPADAVTIDALARLQLGARRYGCQVRLRHVSPDLRALVGFLGLDAVLPDAD